MTAIYVAAYGQQGNSDDDPVWIVGAYSGPGRAKRACEMDAEHRANAALPPILWVGGDDTWWESATPYGYRIVRTGLDAHAGPANTETEPCLMCGEPSVPEGEGPLCERCEAGQEAEANGEQA